MTKLLLHPLTKVDYTSFITHPSHALVIYGQNGMGKTFVAQHITASLLGVSFESLQNQPYFKMWSPNEKGTITIAHAHEIVAFMKLKTTGNRSLRRVVIIEHSDSMKREAQNALLKLIEEPPTDTVIILTAPSEQSLLATIRSRAQALQLRTPGKESVIESYSALGYSSVNIERAYLLSMGLPGLFHALLTGDTEHPIVKMIQVAKEILSADTFIRLTMVDAYAVRQDTEVLVDALGQIARSGIAASAKRGQRSAMAKWHNVLACVQEAQQQLASSGSPKLVLATLFLHM